MSSFRLSCRCSSSSSLQFISLTTIFSIHKCSLFLFHSVSIRRPFFLRELHCLILGTQWLYEFIKLLSSDMLNQTSFHKSLLSAPAVSFAARAQHVNEDVMKFEKRTAHVKWKICSKYHETAPLWAILGAKCTSGWGFLQMTHAHTED